MLRNIQHSINFENLLLLNEKVERITAEQTGNESKVCKEHGGQEEIVIREEDKEKTEAKLQNSEIPNNVHTNLLVRDLSITYVFRVS